MTADQLKTLLADYLTVAAAAKRLKILPRAVQTACQRGQLPGAVLVGREWRIPRAAIDARIKSFGKGQIPQKMRPKPLRKDSAANDLEQSGKSSRK